MPVARILSTVMMLLVAGAAIGEEVQYKVFCSPKEMTVTIDLTSDPKSQVYVDKLKGYPDCTPELNGTKATFHLSLEDIFTCGTTRVTDSKGGKLFYNRIVVEVTKNKKIKLRVKCEELATEHNQLTGRTRTTRTRRDVLPEGFVEAEDVNITQSLIGEGSVPDLNVGVRQNGLSIDTQMNVQPGTPLEMEVFLDQDSSHTYGILVNYMNVTDTTARAPGQKEIIIYKGCTIDPYLFSNFETENGNHLTAKFRAFKFPESSFVMFIGTVKICIRSCQGVPCSNGQLGFGRRRRDLPGPLAEARDPNQVFEVTMTTILKVDQSELENQVSMGNVMEPEGNQRIPTAEDEDRPRPLPPTGDNDFDGGDVTSNDIVRLNGADSARCTSTLLLLPLSLVVAALAAKFAAW